MKIPSPLVAYFAMEIGMSPLVPTSSGGWVFRMVSTTTMERNRSQHEDQLNQIPLRTRCRKQDWNRSPTGY